MTSRVLAGQVYDLAADFSLASNPNGVWSYGYETTLGSQLNLYNGAASGFDGTPGLEAWYSATFPPTPNVPPATVYNSTASDVRPNFGTVIIPAHSVSFHPGPTDYFSVIRWTAPTTGLFNLDVAFRGDDFFFPTTTDVHVLLNSRSLFSADVLAFGPGPSFSDILSVKAGDRIDFAVGFGPDGSYTGDSTGISATLTAVPEPGSALLLSVGVRVVGVIGIGRLGRSSQAGAHSRPCE
jgi:hypothetical protein